jgi:hypothetical protein
LISGVEFEDWSTSESSQSFNIVATIELDVITVEFGESLLEDSGPPGTVLCFIHTEGSVLSLIDWELIIK